MKTKQIAALLSAIVSIPAFAQSNVTVYGQVDVGYVHASGDGLAADSRSGIDSGIWGASRLGFKGEEALGAGLKALFTLEYGLRPDINTGVGSNLNGTGNSRHTVIGLQGDFGTVLAGRQVTLGHVAMSKFDPARATAFAPLTNLRGTSISNSSRADNTAAWISAPMAGVTLGATYSFGGVSGDTTITNSQERIIGLMADYANGPFGMAYVHHRISDLGHVAGTDNSENVVAASYNFGPAKLLGSFQTDKREKATAKVHDRTILSLGVQVPVTSTSKLDVGYAKLNNKNAGTNKDADDAASWGVQYSYDFSKRTMAFAGYTKVSNEGAAKFAAMRTANSATGGDYGVTPAAGMNSTGYGFGIRHSF